MEHRVSEVTAPIRFFEAVNGFQQTEAIRTAVELDLFTNIGTEGAEASELATRCGASLRGIRVLCDYLTVKGFLFRDDQRYSLSPESAAYLSRHSPEYLGSAIQFLLSPTITAGFRNLTAAVKHGGAPTCSDNPVDTDHPVWIEFARNMGPITAKPAPVIAQSIPLSIDKPARILDIAAGHGLFGIAFTRAYPQAQVVAVDWPKVLEVAQENALAAGVQDRFRTLPGDARAIDFGSDYDVALVTNLLHQWDPDTCQQFLRRVYGALKKNGRVAVLEYVVNEDRISPPEAAAFALNMLAATPEGDVYSFSDLAQMGQNAGFHKAELKALPGPQSLVVLTR